MISWVQLKNYLLQNLYLSKQTMWSLLPKSSHSPTVGDFRPIACCNVFYKVITKILANRLSLILETIINHAQAAEYDGKYPSCTRIVKTI